MNFFVRRGDELVARPKPWLAQDSDQDLVQNAAQGSVAQQHKSVQVGGRKRRLEGGLCPDGPRKVRKVTIEDGVIEIEYDE